MHSVPRISGYVGNLLYNRRGLKNLDKISYKSAHTPCGKHSGAIGSVGNNSSDGYDEDSKDVQEESTGDDAASDSSPKCEEGHERTRQPPPEPEETIQVDEGY